ncbi:MAG TPA: PEP/pyruvate-binding domain-containing protein [Micromonosporaceae bacterium]|nr:PEP/pyruvate-binding domain-containing protein [Micromonosporaceae bacterium]
MVAPPAGHTGSATLTAPPAAASRHDPLVLDLDEPGAASVRLAGGKAAGLHALRAAGLPCPGGVVVTTSAYRRSGACPGTPVPDLPAELATRLDALARDTLAAEATRLGGDGTFAVRSSAPGEDGQHRSYAGLHATFLGVPAGGVPQAVRDCWASLWSQRAQDYRATGAAADGAGAAGTAGDPAGPDPLAPPQHAGAAEGMAVVVQPLLPAVAAAVVFTRDPVGDPATLRVELTAGLGDRLVAGEVDADSYQLDRISLRVNACELASNGDGAPVGAAQVRALAELCLRAERSLDRGPLDIESAYVAGHGWLLLQARPITTLSPA